MKIVAILSTTVLPKDGVYKVKTMEKVPDLAGLPHYIGHPATKSIVESLGAVQAPTNLFPGLEPGESALAFSIKQGRSTRRKAGYTTPHQEVNIDDLDVRVITRLDGKYFCPFCGTDTLGAKHCPECGAQ